MTDALPRPEEIHAVHDDIVGEYADTGATESGARDAGAVETVTHLSSHPDAEGPFTIAALLLRNLAATHPFVDANKRTALNVAAAYLGVHGYELHASRELGLVLKVIGINRDLISSQGLATYLESHTESVDNQPTTLQAAATWHRDQYRGVYDWLETN